MRSLKFSTVVLLLAIAKVSCESYGKSCYLNYMLKHELLERSYQIFNNGEKVDAKCEMAVNATITKLRATTNDFCVSEFLRKKYVSETLLKEYLIPQFKSPQTDVTFDDRFTVFMSKANNISTIICNNREVFRPDLRSLMRNGRLQKDSKTKEIECLQTYITVKNKPLSEECTKIVNAIKEEFYSTTTNDMKRVFAAPNDNLVNLQCAADKAKKNQLFEKVFFFVVLAATKNMNNQQIEVLLKGAEGVITSSTRLIFECMLWNIC